MPETPKSYYDALNQWQESQGLSQNAMAKELGVTHVTVGKWMRGENIARRYWPVIRERCGAFFDTDAALVEHAGQSRPLELREYGEGGYLPSRVVTLPADSRQALRVWLEAKEWTPLKLANAIGYNKPRVLEDIFWTGKTGTVTTEKLAAVVRETGFQLDLLPADGEVRKALENEPRRRHMTRRVPALSEARAQEMPTLTGYANGEGAEYFAHVPTDHKEWGCVRILGTSMPGYPEGTLVAGHLVHGTPGHALPNGEDVALRYTDRKTGEPVFLFKRLQKRDANGNLVLVSLDEFTDDVLVPEAWVDWSFAVLIVDKTQV